MSEPNIFGNLLEFEGELGVPRGWYFELGNEPSDWAFVIKLHALLEATVVHCIDASLNRPKLRGFVERMNVGGQLGKLNFAEALGAIDGKHARFIRALSIVRNECIHDVRNVGFKFDGYCEGLPSSERQKLLAVFEGLLEDELPVGDTKMHRDDYVRQNTRRAFWVATIVVLAELYQKKSLARLLRRGGLMTLKPTVTFRKR